VQPSSTSARIYCYHQSSVELTSPHPIVNSVYRQQTSFSSFITAATKPQGSSILLPGSHNLKSIASWRRHNHCKPPRLTISHNLPGPRLHIKRMAIPTASFLVAIPQLRWTISGRRRTGPFHSISSSNHLRDNHVGVLGEALSYFRLFHKIPLRPCPLPKQS
jgi:hypothetical protein